MERSLRRLLRPRSIAAVGGKEAERVIEQCEAFGFDGPVWPVNPRRQAVRGRPCLPSLDALPEPPDVAYLGIRRESSVESVATLSRMGAGGAICYASGFLESEAEGSGGGDLQRRLVSAAGEMPVLGPNCYGLLNAMSGAALWPDQHGLVRVERGVAVLMQSSNLAINLTMQQRGLPISFLGTVGNQAQTGLSDIARELLADPGVTALGLHVEGIDSVRGFESVARQAREVAKPVVALTTGRSVLSRTAALTHTASITGAVEAMEALLERLGIAVVRSLPELLETLKLLHALGPLPGTSIASMSCSGGEAVMIADAACGRRVTFPALAEEHRRRIAATLPSLVTVANPLDYHTFHWANREALVATFSAMLAGPFDLTLLALDYPRPDRCDGSEWELAEIAFADAARITGARVAIVSSLPENMPERSCKRLLDLGIPALGGFDEAISAIAAAAAIGRALAAPPPRPVYSLPAIASEPVLLDEYRSKELLAEAGLPVARGERVHTIAAAVEAARDIGYPVVAKALGIAHKTEAGAVALEISGPTELRAYAARMLSLGNGLLVEEFVEDAVAELHLGVVRDPVCGLALTIGAGGTLVELLDDSRTLILSPEAGNVRDAILGLRMARLLRGYRGRPAADVEAIVSTAMSLSMFAIAYADRIEEIDVNPLIVRAEGEGAIVADALVRIRGARMPIGATRQAVA